MRPAGRPGGRRRREVVEALGAPVEEVTEGPLGKGRSRSGRVDLRRSPSVTRIAPTDLVTIVEDSGTPRSVGAGGQFSRRRGANLLSPSPSTESQVESND